MSVVTPSGEAHARRKQQSAQPPLEFALDTSNFAIFQPGAENGRVPWTQALHHAPGFETAGLDRPPGHSGRIAGTTCGAVSRGYQQNRSLEHGQARNQSAQTYALVIRVRRNDDRAITFRHQNLRRDHRQPVHRRPSAPRALGCSQPRIPVNHGFLWRSDAKVRSRDDPPDFGSMARGKTRTTEMIAGCYAREL